MTDISGTYFRRRDHRIQSGRHHAFQRTWGSERLYVQLFEEIRKLYDTDIPIFAICLGHQLMALATGADTHKLKYGHRGGNHPVKDLEDRTCLYFLPEPRLCGRYRQSGSIRLQYRHLSNVNDGTNEGLEYVGKNIFTVQFHPEACPGPSGFRLSV